MALSNGSVSAGHVDAIAGAVRNLDDTATAEFLALGADLLADAERLGVDLFDRNCRDLARFLANATATDSDVTELDRQRARSRVKRWTDHETGMRHTHIELDPIRDAQLWTAIDHARRQLRRQPGNSRISWDQLQVDALVTAVSDHGQPGQRVVELSVLIDHDTLVAGLHPGSVCELSDGTPLPVATVRQMACRAEIIPIVLDGDGRALDVGRGKRLATEAQRQALRAMHRSCIHPDCDVRFDDCRIHHIIPWERGGKTDVDNLAPVCETNKHHQLIHQGGWSLTLNPDRIATWVRPDGTIYWTGRTADRIANATRGTAA